MGPKKAPLKRKGGQEGTAVSKRRQTADKRLPGSGLSVGTSVLEGVSQSSAVPQSSTASPATPATQHPANSDDNLGKNGNPAGEANNNRLGPDMEGFVECGSDQEEQAKVTSTVGKSKGKTKKPEPTFHSESAVCHIFDMLEPERQYIITIIDLKRALKDFGLLAGKPREPKYEDLDSLSVDEVCGVLVEDHKPRTFASGSKARGGNNVFYHVFGTVTGFSSRFTDSTGQVCSASYVWHIQGWDKDEAFLRLQKVLLERKDQVKDRNEKLRLEYKQMMFAWQEKQATALEKAGKAEGLSTMAKRKDLLGDLVKETFTRCTDLGYSQEEFLNMAQSVLPSAKPSHRAPKTTLTPEKLAKAKTKQKLERLGLRRGAVSNASENDPGEGSSNPTIENHNNDAETELSSILSSDSGNTGEAHRPGNWLRGLQIFSSIPKHFEEWRL